MGENKNPFYGDFGELHHYVKQFNGTDSTVRNPDPYLQKNTGYSQIDILEKVRYSPNKYYDWILNLQYSTSSNIDRYDELKNYNGENLNYAEFYYGPQNRFFSSLKSIVKKDNMLFTNLTTTLAYQRIDEDRISRRFRKTEKLYQEEDVDVYSLDVNFLKLTQKDNRINYGMELTYNDVRSESFYRDINTNETRLTQTRYPDGGSKAYTSAIYLKYKWLPTEKFIFSAGGRYHYGIYNSDFLEGGILPYNNISIANGAFTGSLSMVWHPEPSWQINTVASSGFRNPNIDDYGKVRAKDHMVTVPNPDLVPEYSYNLEAGLTKTIEGYIKLNATAYYTFLNNAIVRSEFSLNGSDSLEYDGSMYRIISTSNSNNAWIRGVSLNVVSDLNTNLSFLSTINLTEGRDITEDLPLSHIPPLFGRTSIKYSIKNSFTEIFVDYNGWKDIEDINIFGEDNVEEATEHGFPGWYTVNFRTGINLTDTFHLQFAIENVFDNFYKPFASAVAGAGRNFVFSLRTNI
jgi:hemoglobin/transferrin/lactoferrin receptor protein